MRHECMNHEGPLPLAQSPTAPSGQSGLPEILPHVAWGYLTCVDSTRGILRSHAGSSQPRGDADGVSNDKSECPSLIARDRHCSIRVHGQAQRLSQTCGVMRRVVYAALATKRRKIEGRVCGSCAIRHNRTCGKATQKPSWTCPHAPLVVE